MATGPLDPRDDPDRYDPDRAADAPSALPPETLRDLDPRHDPDRYDADRYDPARADGGRSLTDLVGKAGAFEEERDNYQWALGLLAVLGFLAAVAFLFSNVLTP